MVHGLTCLGKRETTASVAKILLCLSESEVVRGKR